MAHFGNCDPETADQEYCIFHKPNKSGEEAREFYRKFLERFKPRVEEIEVDGRKIKRLVFDEPVEARGFVFPVLPQKSQDDITIELEDAYVSSIKHRFHPKEYLDNIEYLGHKLRAHSLFEYAIFNNELNLYNVIFEDDVFFIGTKFNSTDKSSPKDDSLGRENQDFQTIFYESRFKKNAFFRDAEFNSSASFRDSVFEQGALFYRTKFMKKISFENSKFCLPTSKEDDNDVLVDLTDLTNLINGIRTEMKMGLLIHSCKFLGEVTFDNSRLYGVMLRDSKFQKETSFKNVNFSKNAMFTGTDFVKYTTFKGSTFGHVTTSPQEISKALSKIAEYEFKLKHVTFHENVDFSDTTFNGDANFELTLFKGNVYFINSIFNRSVSFIGKPDKEDYKFYGILNFSNVDIHRGINIDIPSEWFKLPEAEIEARRVQRLSYEKEGKRDEADRMFVLEMRAKRRARPRNARTKLGKLKAHTHNFIEWLLADLPSEYGTNWIRLFLMSLIVIIGNAIPTRCGATSLTVFLKRQTS